MSMTYDQKYPFGDRVSIIKGKPFEASIKVVTIRLTPQDHCHIDHKTGDGTAPAHVHQEREE